MAIERARVLDTDAWGVSAFSWLVVAGVGAYAVTAALFVLGAASTVQLDGGSRLAGAELLYFLSLSAVQFEPAGGIALWPHAPAFVASVAAPPLLFAGYLFAARVGRGTPSQRASFGVTVAVPYVAVVAWRAITFGPETVTSGAEVGLSTTFEWTIMFSPDVGQTATVEPVAAVGAAAVLAVTCCGFGGWFAGWVRN